MKKILLLTTLFFVSLSFSQVFWSPRSTSFGNSRSPVRIEIAKDGTSAWLEAYDAVTPANPILEFAKSSDEGNTWTTGAIGIPAGTTVCSLNPINSSVCFVGSSATGLYKTTNGGLNWVNSTAGLFVGATSFFDFGAFVNSTTGVAVGDPLGGFMEIYRTTDTGASWTQIGAGAISAIVPGEYAFTNSYAQSGNSIWFLTNKARTFVSQDAGLTWIAYANPLAASDTTPGGSLCLKSATEGIYYNADYAMWKTTDGGVTYNVMEPSGSIRANEITFVPGTDDTYVSIGSDAETDLRGTSFSIDGGLTWENINLLGDTLNVNGTADVVFGSSSFGLCSGFNATPTTGIFKYVGTQFLATETFSNDKAFKATPNPTSGLVTISGKNIANVIITDVLGKQVAASNYTSVENASIDMTSYNAGIYMIKVTNTDGNASTIKVVRQ